jgi:hypothetical protein
MAGWQITLIALGAALIAATAAVLLNRVYGSDEVDGPEFVTVWLAIRDYLLRDVPDPVAWGIRGYTGDLPDAPARPAGPGWGA